MNDKKIKHRPRNPKKISPTSKRIIDEISKKRADVMRELAKR